MNNLAQIDLRCLGASGKIGLFGRRQAGPIVAFVHNAQSSGLLPEVKSKGSDSQRLESIEVPMDYTDMDKYDVRRSSLRALIEQLGMTQAKFGTAVGYSGKSIGQFLNRSKRDGGGEFLITEKVIDKIISGLNSKPDLRDKAPGLTAEWFDQASATITPVTGSTTLFSVTPAVTPPDDAPIIDDEKFPEHLANTWPYMNEEQRNALRYLEAGFRSKRNRKR